MGGGGSSSSGAAVAYAFVLDQEEILHAFEALKKQERGAGRRLASVFIIINKHGHHNRPSTPLPSSIVITITITILHV